jgi:hypothetical protein
VGGFLVGVRVPADPEVVDHVAEHADVVVMPAAAGAAAFAKLAAADYAPEPLPLAVELGLRLSAARRGGAARERGALLGSQTS